MTDAEILLKIKTAIANILDGGQSIALFGKSYSLANLQELNKMERYYARRVAAASSNKRLKVFKIIPM